MCPQVLESMLSCIEHYTAAAKVNKQADFEGLRVYGVLTNLTRFAFFPYDPISKSFCRDEIFVETDTTRRFLIMYDTWYVLPCCEGF